MTDTPLRVALRQSLTALLNDESAKDLPSLLNFIDTGARQCAAQIGPILAEYTGTDELLWFIGQYRGTILSGQREFSSFYCHHSFRDPSRPASIATQHVLLWIYWRLHTNVGSTIAELFEKRCVADERRHSAASARRWNMLRMRLVPVPPSGGVAQNGLCAATFGPCKYAAGEQRQTASCIFAEKDSAHLQTGTVLLDISEETAIGLLPDELWSRLSRTLGMAGDQLARSASADPLEEQIDRILADSPDWKDIQGLARIAVLKEMAKIRWLNRTDITSRGQGNEAYGDLLRFARWLSTSGDTLPCDVIAAGDEDALGNLLKAIQLMCLYWRFAPERIGVERHPVGDAETTSDTSISIDRGRDPGPFNRRALFVCVPRPYKHSQRYAMGLQPRLGFSVVFRDGGDDTALLITSQVLPEWARALDHVASRIGLRQWKVTSDDLALRGKMLFDSEERYASLHERLSALLIGHLEGPSKKNGAPRTLPRAPELLLDRLIAVLEKLTVAVPGFVHEGRRFGVTMLLGLGYHEQTVGESLGKIDTWMNKQSTMVPKEYEGEEDFGTHLSVIKPLIHSCYSLLDWDGVAIFGRMTSARGKVEFTSLLRVQSPSRAATPGSTFRRITGEHSGLFVVDVDRGGAVRVYCGGEALLYGQNGEWRVGSPDNELRDHLVERLRSIGVKTLTKSVSECESFERFIGLLLRISETPGVGAAFIIVRNGNAARLELAASRALWKISPPPERLWESRYPFAQNTADMEVLYRLATMDGATVIELGTGPTFDDQWTLARVFPRKLICSSLDLEKCWKEWYTGDWRDWRDFLSWGSRRSSSLALAMSRPDVVVISVSTDGPISIMTKNKTPVIQWPEKKV